MESTHWGEKTQHKKGAPQPGSRTSLCCCEKFILEKTKKMRVCLHRCSVSFPAPPHNPRLKVLLEKCPCNASKGFDDFNFIQQSTMIARHFWAKVDGNMPPPISTQLWPMFDLKSFLRKWNQSTKINWGPLFLVIGHAQLCGENHYL